MNSITIIAGVTGGLILVILLFLLVRRKTHPEKFLADWKDLQKYCANKDTWPLAIITADNLLDKALVKKHIKGKSMGERLVTVQKQLTDNDSVWFAHNLAKKLKEEAAIRLKQSDVKKSLLGFRQALRDLGVLKDEAPGKES